MANEACPNTSTCPIFKGFLDAKYVNVYKNLYCLAGEEGMKKCKRYIIKTLAGKCPTNLLPNSTKTIEEILESLEKTN
jgi:hypothetical protein